MLVSLALVLAPALTPRNSRLKDAMAQLDGALKSLDTDTSEKGVIMEGVMGATTERSDVLQPASEPEVQPPSLGSAPLQQPPPAAVAAEEVAPVAPLPAAAVALRGAETAQQSSEAPLLEVPQATTPFAAAAKLEADEASPTTTEWEEWEAQREQEHEEGGTDEGHAEDRWRTDGEPNPFPAPLPSSEPPPSPEPMPSPNARAARVKMKQPQPPADVKSRLDEWRGRAAQSTAPITVLLLSDRVLPVQVAFGSILLNTNSSLRLFVIGENVTGLQERLEETLPLRTDQNLSVIAMADAEAEIAHLSPPWMSAGYGQSINNASWRTSHTILQREWDHDPMHSSPFNHLRFYLPYLPFLAEVDHLIFLDDDVIVQGEIAEMVVQMPPGKAIAAPCDTWVWGDSCSQFTFVANATDWRKNSAVLYLNSAWRSCGSDEACRMSAYEETIQQISRNATGKEIDLSRQPVWNFGVVMYNCTEWRRLGMTERYHTWLRADYALHLWPEDSLSYGLGIPYLAFEGVVVCWNDLVAAPFRDGMGFISNPNPNPIPEP